MMAAAIQGSYAEYQMVKTRGVLIIKIEVPLERQAEVFASLGYPLPGVEIPVAVARLQQLPEEGSTSPPERVTRIETNNPREKGDPAFSPRPNGPPQDTDPASPAPERSPVTASTPPSAGPESAKLLRQHRARERFQSLPPNDRFVAHAGMLAGDPAFQAWVETTCGPSLGADPEERAAQLIRLHCQVGSRRELATRLAARERFTQLLAKFEADTGRMAESR